MLAVVGGGLTTRLIAKVLPFGPDYIAVRGAACRKGRAGKLEARRIQQLKRLLHEWEEPLPIRMA
jgi:hypothetical protein